MLRRLIWALAALVLAAAGSPAIAAPVHTAPFRPAVTPRFQDDTPSEDQFEAFSMPGLTPDNLTDMVLKDIDSFWAGEFANDGLDYYAAGIVPVTDVTHSSCGDFGPYDNPAAYCPIDDTVYVSVPLGKDIRTNVGDFAWIAVLAHEWGHHVQVLMHIDPPLTIERELQADCFSGAYALRAKQQGFLQEGDVTEAVAISVLSADPVDMGETVPGAHGSSDYRVTAFMQGYFSGVPSCLNTTFAPDAAAPDTTAQDTVAPDTSAPAG
jgi:predicted metalloprotease